MSWRLFGAAAFITAWIILYARSNVEENVEYPFLSAIVAVVINFVGVFVVFKIVGVM